jgi:alpha-tubulin suppressor-like RCC1 family protein
LGNGTGDSSLTPIQVLKADGTTLTKVTQVSVENDHACARLSDGTIWCWGRGQDGRLGTGNENDQTVAKQVVGPTTDSYFMDAEKVFVGTASTCALKADGTVWCWGNNSYDQIGNGTQTNPNSRPIQTLVGASTSLTNVAQLSVSANFACALKSNGTVYCWGENQKGQLGNNTTTNQNFATQVVGANGTGTLQNVEEIGTGNNVVCARKSDGTVWCWGGNDYGQLGQGTTDQQAHSYPLQILEKSGSSGIPITNAAQLVVTRVNSYVKKVDGTVWGFGDNGDCALAQGTGSRSEPLAIPLFESSGVPLNNINYFSWGYAHAATTCIRKNDCQILCWGNNEHGQVGTGTITPAPYAICYPTHPPVIKCP